MPTSRIIDHLQEFLRELGKCPAERWNPIPRLKNLSWVMRIPEKVMRPQVERLFLCEIQRCSEWASHTVTFQAWSKRRRGGLPRSCAPSHEVPQPEVGGPSSFLLTRGAESAGVAQPANVFWDMEARRPCAFPSAHVGRTSLHLSDAGVDKVGACRAAKHVPQVGGELVACFPHL